MLLFPRTPGKSYKSFSELSQVTVWFLPEHHVANCSDWQKEHVQAWEVKVDSVVYDIKP